VQFLRAPLEDGGRGSRRLLERLPQPGAARGGARRTAARKAAAGGLIIAVSTAEETDVLSEINITPLVDVMLVLLVAFVITIPALTNAIHVNLPRTVNTTPPEQQRAITVTVDTAGTIYLDDQPVAQEDL